MLDIFDGGSDGTPARSNKNKNKDANNENGDNDDKSPFETSKDLILSTML